MYYSIALHNLEKRKSKKRINKKIIVYKDKNVECIEKRNKQVYE